MFAALGRGGWVGVDLFFVLSGFLVAGLLFAEYQRRGGISAGRFLLRRAFKIYPAFWALLLITILLRAPLGGRGLKVDEVLGEIFFVQNYHAHLWGHTWSLAVEEHFYLLLVLFIWLAVRVWTHPAGRDPFYLIPWLFLGVAVACLGLRMMTNVEAGEIVALKRLFPTHLRIDSLLFGVLIAYVWHFHGTARLKTGLVRSRWLLVLAGAGLLAPAFIWETERYRWVTVYGLTLFYLGAGALVLAVLGFPGQTRSRALKTLATIGLCSYSIYLWHMPMLDVLWHLGAKGLTAAWPGNVLIYLVACIVTGLVAARLIEFPMLQLRDRLVSRPSAALEAPSAPRP